MWSVHASKQASIHTHARNEVTLVWGSLRLAPINLPFDEVETVYQYTRI